MPMEVGTGRSVGGLPGASGRADDIILTGTLRMGGSKATSSLGCLGGKRGRGFKRRRFARVVGVRAALQIADQTKVDGNLEVRNISAGD